MTKDEWLDIGYEKHLIEDIPLDKAVSFYDVYKIWFKVKMHKIKAQSLDRIEVTFNKYYLGSDFIIMYVHDINDKSVCSFLEDLVVRFSINYKEFGRIWQIVNNVLVYAHDFTIGFANLIDWGFIRRYIYNKNFLSAPKHEYIISIHDRRVLFNSVLNDDIYPLKRSACLMLLMNFYLGLRIGELASLMFCDFDLDSKILRIYKTEVKFFPRDDLGSRSGSMVYDVVNDVKTRSSFRVLPLTDECIYIFNLIVEHHKLMGYESDYLCYDGSDTIMTRSLERTLTRLCVLCNIPHINSHRIRKTYASLLHMNGVPTRVITDLCGHSDMETTERCYLLGYESGYSIYLNQINQALKNDLNLEVLK